MAEAAAAVGDPTRIAIVASALTIAACGGCGHGAPASAASVDVRVALAPVHAFEESRRASTDFAHAPRADRALGVDPYDVEAIGADRFVGILRGAGVDAVVLLDHDARELQRLPAPPRPSAVAVSGSTALVVGELASYVQRYRLANGSLAADGRIDVPGVVAMRGVTLGDDGVVHVVEEKTGRLITLRPNADGSYARDEAFVGAGAVRIVRTPKHVLVDAMLDHAIVVRTLEGETVARLTNDGPLWGFDALESPDGASLVVVAGGVEDHPLDRHPGFFGFIDSFVYAWTVEKGAAKRTSATNVSALGVVVPKAVALHENAGNFRVEIIGAGGEASATMTWSAASASSPTVTTASFPPGGASIAIAADGTRLVADPLLDAWIVDRGQGPKVVKTPDEPARVLESRLGEALLFTTVMAPWDTSDGAHSRFTCETCHFEGYGDGRTHHTGRQEIHAVTKPLLGLFNNRPHFTRALDPDLTTVAHNEFRVAGAGSGHDPWFTLDPKDHPWLSDLGLSEPVPPDRLRLAFVAFLADFGHSPNPSVVGRSAFDDRERRGAEVFRDRCASCHAARLVTDDPRTEVPFDRWESLVFDPEGAIVWARDGYEKTGIEPYVHANGARTTSLRRVYKKHPFFTNGSANDLADVLARARFVGAVFMHDHAPEGAQPIEAADREALLAFLSLL